MNKILLFFLLFPVVIYCQPKYLTRDNVLYGGASDIHDTLYKKLHLKSYTKWEIKENGNKLIRETAEFDQTGKRISWISYNNNGQKAFTTYYEYNSTGRLTQQNNDYYNEEAALSSIQKFTFDSSGRYNAIIMYKDSKPDGGIIFKYNDAQNSVKLIEFDKDSVLTESMESFFNDKDFLVKSIQSDKANFITVNYSYSPGIVRMNSFKGDSLINIEIIKFDSKNNITEGKSIDPDSVSFIDYSAEYNVQGWKTIEREFEKNGSEASRFEWKYDKNGNQTRQDYYYLSKLTERKIYSYNKNGLMIESASGGKNVNFKKGKTVYTYEYY